jgi:hypothetical protein
MRVSELMAVLARLDPAIEVLAHARHGECQYQFFDVGHVALVNAVRSRDPIGLPHVEFDDDAGRPLAVLTLTADF